MKKTIPILLTTLVFLNLLPGAAAQTPSDPSRGSGAIEADIILIAAESGGRVLALQAAEGAEVSQGDVLLQLDPSLAQSQQQQAQAALDAARARLAEVSAPARPEEIAVAQAELAQAEAARAGAEAVWQELTAQVERPLALIAQVDAARGQVSILEKEVEAAQAALQAAEIQRDEAARDQSGDAAKTRAAALAKQAEAARFNLAATQAELDGARWQRGLLAALRDEPLALIVQAHAAERALRQAAAALVVAEANLALARAGPLAEEIAIAQAQVQQAEAALRRSQIVLDKLRLTAPRGGVIVEQTVQAGELARPGATLLKLADLDRVTLTVFVPEAQIGRVSLGQPAEVSVDAYPGEVFPGLVTQIGQEAEFTPKNVQTEEERVNLVFAVKISLENPDHRLKPGMPADSVIRHS